MAAGTTNRKRASLAGRVITFTILAVALAVLAIGSVSVAGVYNLALTEDASRLGAYRQLLADDISSHLLIVSRTLDGLSASTGLRGQPESISAELARSAKANADYVDVLAVTDATGVVVASSKAGVLPSSLSGIPGLAALGAARSARFAHAGLDAPVGVRGLWVGCALGDGRTLVARARTDFLGRLLDEVTRSAAESRSAYVVGTRGELVAAGKGSALYEPGALSFEPEATGARTGIASLRDHRSAAIGFYQDLGAATELGWRVVVTESRSVALRRVGAALLPAGAATLIAALLGVLSAFVFARRLVSPLTTFQRRAREVASGAYVRPLVIDRDDELGSLADAFNEMGVRLNSLQDVARLLASASNAADVMDAVLSAIGHLIGTGDAAVMLVSSDGSQLELARARGVPAPEARFAIPLDEPSPLTTAFRERRAVPFEGQQARWAFSVFRLFDAATDRAGVAVPLVIGDEALGVVVALAAQRRTLTEAQIETVRAFSSQAAVAVRNARLYEHERTARREAEVLREVAELTSGGDDLAAALDRVGELAAALLGMSGCTVALVDRSSLGLDAAPEPEQEGAVLEAWNDAQASGDELARREPALLTRAAGAPPLPCGEGGAVLLVPLVRGDMTLGVLALAAGPGAAPIGGREMALAGTLGKQVSLALDNAALLQEARERAVNLETVFRISQAVSSSLQLNVVLNRVLDVVQKIFSAEAVSLMGYDPVKRTIVTQMARGVVNREMLYFQAEPGEDVPGAVFESRSPELHGDLAPVDTPLARLALAQGLRSLLAVPLLARGRSIGVLSVYDRLPDAFSAGDRELLMTFASQAALAIDTAGLYGKEHHVASVLQSSILPETLPEMPGLESAAFYLPAGTEAEIGGDFYDLFSAPDGSVVVAIGDVCGKGVGAATKTSAIRYSLRGMVAAGARPADALAELNRVVATSGDPADIVTAWVGFIAADRTSLVYAGAGHPPALLFRAGSHRFERLEATGPLLGAISSAGFDECEVALSPDDILLMYTDGVTEARHEKRFFGEGRVRRSVRRSASVRGIVDSLLTSLGEFSSGVMRDDAAALAVRIVEQASPDGRAGTTVDQFGADGS